MCMIESYRFHNKKLQEAYALMRGYVYLQYIVGFMLLKALYHHLMPGQHTQTPDTCAHIVAIITGSIFEFSTLGIAAIVEIVAGFEQRKFMRSYTPSGDTDSVVFLLSIIKYILPRADWPSRN